MSALDTAVMTPLQSARFDRILAATRRLMAEQGADGMTMRAIASMSRVSEGTLYNRFGSKDRLVAVAMVEYFEQAVQTHIEQQTRKAPVARIVHSVDVVVRSILEAPAFTRGLMSAFFKLGGDREMPNQLAARVYASWMPLLLEMQQRKQLHDWVSVPLLCEELCDREFGTVMKWAQGNLGNATFRDQLLYSLLSSLLGASKGRQAREIADIQARLGKRLAGARRASL